MNGERRLVLLTGSAGRIGRSLRERLPQFGWTVRGFDRVSGDTDDRVGDIRSADDLAAALDGVSAVAHFAGVPTEAPWPQLRDANVDGLVTLFEAARRAGVRRVVYASSNHAAGFTPVGADLPADAPPRPEAIPYRTSNRT